MARQRACTLPTNAHTNRHRRLSTNTYPIHACTVFSSIFPSLLTPRAASLRVGDTDSDQTEYAQDVDPMKPTDVGVPDLEGLELGHGLPLMRTEGNYGRAGYRLILVLVRITTTAADSRGRSP